MLTRAHGRTPSRMLAGRPRAPAGTARSRVRSRGPVAEAPAPAEVSARDFEHAAWIGLSPVRAGCSRAAGSRADGSAARGSPLTLRVVGMQRLQNSTARPGFGAHPLATTKKSTRYPSAPYHNMCMHRLLGRRLAHHKPLLKIDVAACRPPIPPFGCLFSFFLHMCMHELRPVSPFAQNTNF